VTQARSEFTSLALAIGLIALVGVGLALALPLLSLEMERMGVTGRGIGIAAAVAGVAGIIVVPYIPGIAARFGVGRTIGAALALTIAALLLFPLIRTYTAWLIFRVLLSVGLCTLFVLSEYWITSAAPAHRRGLIMGIYATVLALGFAAGPAILALVGTSGFQPYMTGAAIFLAAAIPLGLALARGDNPEIENAPHASVMAALVAVPLASAAALASGAIETAGISLLPVFGLHQGLGAEAAALLVSCVALGNVASQVPLGLVADRMPKARLLAVIAVVGLILTLLIPAARREPLMLYALLFAWGGIAGGLYTVGLAHLAASYQGRDLALGNAAFVLLFNAGPLVGPPLVGAGLDASPTYGFAAAMSVFFVLVLLTAAWPRVRQTL
jgi:MFS family permease